jgi:hypothetical protein
VQSVSQTFKKYLAIDDPLSYGVKKIEYSKNTDSGYEYFMLAKKELNVGALE